MRILCRQVYFIPARSFAPATFTTVPHHQTEQKYQRHSLFFFNHSRIHACVRARVRASDASGNCTGSERKKIARPSSFILLERIYLVNGMLTFESVRRLSCAAHDKNDSTYMHRKILHSGSVSESAGSGASSCISKCRIASSRLYRCASNFSRARTQAR
jgi:hypothetical protein